MKSFWSLIPRRMLKSKKNAFYVGIGIILSISLIIAMNIMIDGLMKDAYKRGIEEDGGTYDVFLYSPDKKNVEKLKKDEVVEKLSSLAYLGKYKVPNTKYELEIDGCENNLGDFLNLKLLQGKYPEKDNEIIIEDWILDSMPQKYHIGDKVKLNLEIGSNKKKNEDKEFVLTGIFNHKFTTNQEKNKGSAYVTEKYVEDTIAAKDTFYKGYFAVNKKYPIQMGVQFIMGSNEYNQLELHTNYGRVIYYEGMKAFNKLSNILSVVLCIVASIIIYNIFNMSVTERIIELGMLRAIGASPVEIEVLVLGEGLILGLIFIPISIIVGNVVMRSIINIAVGNKIFTDITYIPYKAIISSVVVGISTILLGTYFPAKKASKISAMEAINSNNNLQLEGSNVNENSKINKFINKKASFTTSMGYLNLHRNKKRGRSTIVSLTICIIMFIFVGYLIRCSTNSSKSIRESVGGDFAIVAAAKDNPNGALYDEDIKLISEINGIDKINKVKSSSTIMQIPKDAITSEGYNILSKQMLGDDRYDFQKGRYRFKGIEVYGYTSDKLNELNKYLDKGEINEKELLEKPIAIVGQNLNYSNNTKLKVGDKIELQYWEYAPDGRNIKTDTTTFTIGGLLKADFKTTSPNEQNVIFTSEKVAEKYLYIKGYEKVSFNLKKNANYNEVEKELKDKLSKYRNLELVSYREELEKAKKKDIKVTLITYGFVAVLAIVSIINLFNIMSMNVMIRKREIGMLRAVGLGNDEVGKMIAAEGLFYGISSAFWGTLLGYIINFLFFLLARKTLTNGMTWSISISNTLAIWAAVVLICYLAARHGTKKLFTSSIVEDIKVVE